MNKQSHQQYIELYEQFAEVLAAHSVSVMNDRRGEAFSAFCKQGFPSRKEERYKYTDIQALFAPDYGLNLQRLDVPFKPEELFHCEVPNLSTLLFYVVNDTLSPFSSIPSALPQGVFIGSMKQFAAEQPEILRKHYGRLAPVATDSLAALNTMLAQDGLVVYIPRGVRLEKTIQVVNLLKANVPLMVCRRVLIIVEEQAEAKILFCDHALEDVQFLTSEVIEAYVGENASLEIYSLEETHQKNIRVSNTYVEQQQSSRLNHQSITLHNGQTRNTFEVLLNGAGAECWLGGGVIADKQQRVDNNTLITHRVPHCESHELYKYVLNEQSTGAFAGRVLVEKDAQKTVSQETNQNLCMTPEARMYTQPMLEIYADDVKCSHGSTVGQLNEAALFYMQQRGISLAEAKLLLQTAFIGEVIDQVPLAPLRDRLRYLVDQRFRGQLNHCEGCKLCK